MVDILNEVWEEITAESVKNCWKKSTLINDDMTIETHAADQSDTNDTEEMFGILVSVVKNNDCKPLGEKESDEAVWELSLAMKECHCNDAEESRNFVEGWVAMEENDYSHELLADEINAMMEVDVKDKEEGEDEEDEAINSKKEPVLFDE